MTKRIHVEYMRLLQSKNKKKKKKKKRAKHRLMMTKPEADEPEEAPEDDIEIE